MNATLVPMVDGALSAVLLVRNKDFLSIGTAADLGFLLDQAFLTHTTAPSAHA